jgi:hypothetical protein
MTRTDNFVTRPKSLCNDQIYELLSMLRGSRDRFTYNFLIRAGSCPQKWWNRQMSILQLFNALHPRSNPVLTMLSSTVPEFVHTHSEHSVRTESLFARNIYPFFNRCDQRWATWVLFKQHGLFLMHSGGWEDHACRSFGKFKVLRDTGCVYPTPDLPAFLIQQLGDCLPAMM